MGTLESAERKLGLYVRRSKIDDYVGRQAVKLLNREKETMINYWT